jgi:hypothetical protein
VLDRHLISSPSLTVVSFVRRDDWNDLLGRDELAADLRLVIRVPRERFRIWCPNRSKNE